METGIELLHVLQDFRLSMPSTVDGFFLLLSSPFVYMILPICIGSLLLWFVGKENGEKVLLSITASMAVSAIVKFAVKQPRPWVMDPTIQPPDEALKTAGGYSLPSGHTSCSVAGFGSVFLSYGNKALRMACVSLMILIPFSRLYLCVHTPLDIITGAAVAIGVILINCKAVPWSHRSGRNRTVFLAAYIAVFIISAIWSLLAGANPIGLDYMGMAMGLLFGLMIEERFVHYEIRDRDTKRNLKMAALGLLMIAAAFSVPYLILGRGVGSYLGGALCLLSATVFCPYVFKRMDEKGA